jgi:ribosomal protein S8
MNKIADFIIRYRNSNKKELELKTTKIGLSLLDVLEKTGYIKYSLVSKTQKKNDYRT